VPRMRYRFWRGSEGPAGSERQVLSFSGVSWHAPQPRRAPPVRWIRPTVRRRSKPNCIDGPTETQPATEAAGATGPPGEAALNCASFSSQYFRTSATHVSYQNQLPSTSTPN
jgi:hypothetical protein